MLVQCWMWLCWYNAGCGYVGTMLDVVMLVQCWMWLCWYNAGCGHFCPLTYHAACWSLVFIAHSACLEISSFTSLLEVVIYFLANSKSLRSVYIFTAYIVIHRAMDELRQLYGQDIISRHSMSADIHTCVDMYLGICSTLFIEFSCFLKLPLE